MTGLHQISGTEAQMEGAEGVLSLGQPVVSSPDARGAKEEGAARGWHPGAWRSPQLGCGLGLKSRPCGLSSDGRGWSTHGFLKRGGRWAGETLAGGDSLSGCGAGDSGRGHRRAKDLALAWSPAPDTWVLVLFSHVLGLFPHLNIGFWYLPLGQCHGVGGGV